MQNKKLDEIPAGRNSSVDPFCFKMNAAKEIPDPGWTTLTDGSQATMRWLRPGGKYVAYIVKRADGRFTKWTEYYSDDEYELCWIQQEMGGSFYDSEEIAVKEMHGMLPWTLDVEPERQRAEQETG